MCDSFQPLERLEIHFKLLPLLGRGEVTPKITFRLGRADAAGLPAEALLAESNAAFAKCFAVKNRRLDRKGVEELVREDHSAKAIRQRAGFEVDRKIAPFAEG